MFETAVAGAFGLQQGECFGAATPRSLPLHGRPHQDARTSYPAAQSNPS